jgi:hypothetical protein
VNLQVRLETLTFSKETKRNRLRVLGPSELTLSPSEPTYLPPGPVSRNKCISLLLGARSLLHAASMALEQA